MSLRTKFFLWVSALLTVVVSGGGSLTIYSERRALKSEAEQRHRQLLQSLKQICEESLYKNDELVFLNYIPTLKMERGFLEASLVEASGRIRIHSDPVKAGDYFSSPQEKRIHKSSEDYFAQRYRAASGEKVVDLTAPVFFAEERVGTARLLLSESVLDAFLRHSALQAAKRIALILLLALLAGFIGAFLLAKTLVSPLQLIVQGMRQVSKGRLDLIVLPKRDDEVGWMGQEINNTVLKLRELDEMKRDFVAGVTHELRSPLSAIDSLLRRIHGRGEQASHEERQDYILTALNNTTRLSKLVDNLLIAAKIDSGRMELSVRRFDLRNLLKEVIQLYRPLAEEKNLDLICALGNDSVYVKADPDKVVQITNNLLSNAFKYTRSGQVKIALLFDGADATVSVEDTGQGLPEDDREKVFEKFFRSARSSKINGTGLGLYITKALVEAQRGRLSLRENPKGGSIFSFTLSITGSELAEPEIDAQE